MITIIIFISLSLFIVFISARNLKKIHSHGFFRFLSWECIAWLFANNYRYWFTDPFSIPQFFSWFFLIVAVYMVLAGVVTMKKKGRAEKKARDEEHLFSFEATTALVSEGIFRYIRHPLYASLLFLNWGVFLKHFEIHLLVTAIASTIFLYITARYDEKECEEYFGEEYRLYRKRTRLFIPWIV
ncbi:MAG TPA: isoprenylcysteine carboxylmethyltransferase family protein [Prolixibacteraceae bacterium]|nr:isoprenylcysteine carboxylmethyltransferase family protein [Prolixibacteraceae bacterium]